MIDGLASAAQPLVDAIHARPLWVDDALIVAAVALYACTHWLRAQRICHPDGSVRRTTAEALQCARIERILEPAAWTAFVAFLALYTLGDGHLWATDREATLLDWMDVALLVLLLPAIAGGSFATVSALLGKPVFPVAKQRESDEYVAWKQEAFVEYAKKAPYPGSQPAVDEGLAG